MANRYAIQFGTIAVVSLLLLGTFLPPAPAVNLHSSTAPHPFSWTTIDESSPAHHRLGGQVPGFLGSGASSVSTLARAQALVTNASWYEFPPSTAPPGWSYGAAMTYDPQINGILLFGGALNVPPYGTLGTWEYIQGAWQDMTGTFSTAPSPRYGASLVYDVNDSYALLFGGYSPSCSTKVGNYSGALCNDTWAFTPSEGWTELFPNSAPLARMNFAMADDPADGYLVLFGGQCWYCGLYQFYDTWTFRAGQWTEWTSRTTIAPHHDGFSSATFDAAARQIVMYGSASTCPTSGETWTFSKGNWTNATTSVRPPHPVWASVAYDPTLGGVVEFGGYSYSARCEQALSNETWLFDNGTWTNLTSMTTGAPPGDHQVSMVYDTAVGAVVILGSEGYLSAPNGTRAVWSWPGAPMVTDVTVSPPGGDAPFNVTFSANSSGGSPPYIDTWNFGDGSPNMTGSTVTHEYVLPTAYNATVTTGDTAGRVGVTYLSVSANGALVASGSSTGTLGEAPWTVQFYANASGGKPPITWSWTFGDGASSTAAWPVHTFANAGDYSTALTVRDSSSAQVHLTFPIRVVPALVANPSASPRVGQAPLDVDFTPGDAGGVAPIQFDWNFGDGSPNDTSPNPSHEFVGVGTFWVRLTIVDGLFDTVTSSLNVTVTGPLVAVPSATPDGGPAPLTVAFEDQSTGGTGPLSVTWSFGDGSGPVTGLTAAHTYTVPGTYAAAETVSDSAGTVAHQETFITVVAPLSVSLTVSPLLAKAPAHIDFELHSHDGEGPFAYSYEFGDGGSSSGSAAANHTYAMPGTYEVRASIVDAFDELGEVRANVTVVAPLVARISVNPQTVLLGQTLNLSADPVGGFGPYSYIWSGLPPGCTSSGKDTLSCEPTAVENYTISVTVSDLSHQTSTASTWVLVSSLSPVECSACGIMTGELLPYLLTSAVVVAILVGVLVVLRRRRGRSQRDREPARTEDDPLLTPEPAELPREP